MPENPIRSTLKGPNTTKIAERSSSETGDSGGDASQTVNAYSYQSSSVKCYKGRSKRSKTFFVPG